MLLGVVEMAGARHLDGHRAIELGISAPVHRAEGADADRLEEFKAAELARLPVPCRAGRKLESRAASATRNHLTGLDRLQFGGTLAVRAEKVHGGTCERAVRTR